MRYRNRFKLATTSLMGLIVACSDRPSTLGPDAADLSQPSLAAITRTATGFSFTVDPSQTGTFVYMGDHRVVFPANSICDPATSSYGPSAWDLPCSPLASPITISADTMTVNGHPYLRFSPELRFVPSADPKQWVMLYLKDRSAGDPIVGPTLNILYEAPDGSLSNESLLDPTMVTRVEGSSSMVYRRLKHFSGYLVSSRTEMPSEGMGGEVY